MIESNPHPATSVEQVVTQVRGAVERYYNAQDAWHNLDHAVRVVAMAKQVNMGEKADSLLVEAGAWLHQYHLPNLDQLQPVLASLAISDSIKSDLYHIVAVCRPNLIDSRPDDISDAAWKAARVVFDGDALDLIGPSGIFREVNCNMSARGKSHGEALDLARAVHNLFADKLQTDTAKQLAQPGINIVAEMWREFDRYEAELKRSGARSY